MQAISSHQRYGVEDTERGVVELLLDALPSGAMLIGPDGRILVVNQQAEVILGWAAMSLEGQRAHELLHCNADDREESREHCPIARILQGEKPQPAARMAIRCRGDSIKPIEYRCTPYPTGSGFGAILAFNDIAQQLETEKDLRSLASVAEASPVAIAVLNEDANLLQANPMMMSLMDRFGFGEDLHAAVLPANIAVLVAQCLKTQAPLAGIEALVGERIYEWKLVPLANDRIVRGYGIDLTPRGPRDPNSNLI